MAFDDLDLQFEDEEEASKPKKSDAVHTSVDVQFNTTDLGQTKSHSNLPKPNAQAASPPGSAPVTKIADARAAQAAVKKPAAPAAAVARPVAKPVAAAAPRAVGTSALQEGQYEVGSAEVVQLREEMRRTQFEADVKVAVAEYKVELLSELLSDTKLMQHQIEQLLVRIHAKHPDMKQEVLMIKKILADFTAKKRK